MKNGNLTKEQILQRVSEYDILNHFLAPYRGNRPLKRNQQIKRLQIKKNLDVNLLQIIFQIYSIT